jgi:hypothetical protein
MNKACNVKMDTLLLRPIGSEQKYFSFYGDNGNQSPAHDQPSLRSLWVESQPKQNALLPFS